jgi:hypothetical protein
MRHATARLTGCTSSPSRPRGPRERKPSKRRLPAGYGTDPRRSAARRGCAGRDRGADAQDPSQLIRKLSTTQHNALGARQQLGCFPASLRTTGPKLTGLLRRTRTQTEATGGIRSTWLTTDECGKQQLELQLAVASDVENTVQITLHSPNRA